MRGGLEPVDGGLCEERVGHESEPFDGFAVRGNDRRSGAVAFDDELVDIGGVEGVERLEGEVVDDEQIDAEQLAHLGVVAVVESAGAKSFEEAVAAFEVDRVAAADGGVAEGGGEKRCGLRVCREGESRAAHEGQPRPGQ